MYVSGVSKALWESFLGPINKYLARHCRDACKNARKMPIFMLALRKKTAMEIKFSVQVPIWSITIHCAVLGLIQERQTEMTKLGGVLIYINFRWKRTKKNLSVRVEYRSKWSYFTVRNNAASRNKLCTERRAWMYACRYSIRGCYIELLGIRSLFNGSEAEIDGLNASTTHLYSRDSGSNHLWLAQVWTSFLLRLSVTSPPLLAEGF